MNVIEVRSTDCPVETAVILTPESQNHAVKKSDPDPKRAAAGRAGARRLVELTRLGREYEREHGLTPARQRRRQLLQLGKRYELDHGLRESKPRRRHRGDVWQDFLAALARVVKPIHRPAIEKLAASFQPVDKSAA